MALASRKWAFRALAALAGLGLAVLVVPQPASAGFLDRLFGSIRRAVDGPEQPVSDPFTSLIDHLNGSSDTRVKAENSGPAKAFCVRSCDGHYFPVLAHPGLSAADACRSFCPASQTKLYLGSDIEYATANDGSRYGDMPNAFAYRKQLVSNCTCNSHSPFGLANINATSDPTLRPGDIVATDSGMMAYTGKTGDRTNVAANFTPVQNFNGLSRITRDTLSETKISPATQRAAEITATIPRAALNARAEAPPQRGR